MKKLLSLFAAASFCFFPKALSEELPPVQENPDGSLFSEVEYLPAVPLFLSAEAEQPKTCEVPADISFLKENREVFNSALKKFPCHLLQTLHTVSLIDDSEMPRALAGRYSLKLRSDVFGKPEIEPLLLHEFAHIIDLGGLSGSHESGESAFYDGAFPVFRDDPSLQFYEISWKNSAERKSEMSELDFVSGYAMTDPFEDFAESLLFYRLHGSSFRELAKERPVLKEKYDFFRETIFQGKEFLMESPRFALDFRPWDVTKL